MLGKWSKSGCMMASVGSLISSLICDYANHSMLLCLLSAPTHSDLPVTEGQTLLINVKGTVISTLLLFIHLLTYFLSFSNISWKIKEKIFFKYCEREKGFIPLSPFLSWLEHHRGDLH